MEKYLDFLDKMTIFVRGVIEKMLYHTNFLLKKML